LLFLRSLLWPLDWLFLFRFSPEEVEKTSPFLALNGLCFKRCPMIVSFGTDVGFHLNVGYLVPSSTGPGTISAASSSAAADWACTTVSLISIDSTKLKFPTARASASTPGS